MSGTEIEVVTENVPGGRMASSGRIVLSKTIMIAGSNSAQAKTLHW